MSASLSDHEVSRLTTRAARPALVEELRAGNGAVGGLGVGAAVAAVVGAVVAEPLGSTECSDALQKVDLL